MNIVKIPDYNLCIKTLSKQKFSGIYGTIVDEVNQFFKEYSTFEQVWNKSYMLFENGYVRVNKVRLENPLQNSGKSGGYRLIIICDKRTKTIGLLYIYPKVGPHGKETLNKEFSKKLVKNFAKAKAEGKLEKHAFPS